MRFSLRLKLTLVSLLLLFIPLTGFRFSELIKQDLMQSRKETMLFSARAVASALSGRTGLFDRELFHSLSPTRDLYLFELSNPIRINGKTDDWQPELKQARIFGQEHLLFSAETYRHESLHYRHLTGIRGEYLFAVFLVTDDKVIYRPPDSPRHDLSDHLQIGVEDQQGRLHQYLLTATQPGWVNAFLMPEDSQVTIPEGMEARIQGMWVESDAGYILEIRLHGDPARIHQMLDKLIENAVSFHTEGTAIEIVLTEHNGAILLKVANEGPIIPQELQNQIFNSMVSYGRQKDKQPHLGLGLYIVRTIVEHHHGTIAVGTTENGSGTVFSLSL